MKFKHTTNQIKANPDLQTAYAETAEILAQPQGERLIATSSAKRTGASAPTKRGGPDHPGPPKSKKEEKQ